VWLAGLEIEEHVMFFGSFRAEIDERGVLTLPQRWRADLASGLVLTQSVDPCLCIFPRDKFEAILQEVDQLGPEMADSRKWSRYLAGPASELAIDRNGSIEIPEQLRRFANLSERVNLVGVTSRIEVWNPVKLQEVESKDLEQMSEIAERVGKIIRTSMMS
jgi:MraZ protein